MSLTTKQEELIISQWTKLASDADGVAEKFYNHLFTSFPQVRSLFKTQDFVAQGMYGWQILAL